ncbi:MAG: S-methyl-5-thioribose-1-phosphate isomerase, partial [Planctomycetaceae bacterium]|nr:S-methyl-5-thioribose-1-phosphate isomerase [Planctomycetaceae bacterium]
MPSTQPPPTLEWTGGTTGFLRLLDQTRLPQEVVTIDCRTAEDVWQAIKRLSVRGAPAIGVAAAWGVIVGIQPAAGSGRAALLQQVHATADYLATSRPTAVNLFWALNRMRKLADSLPETLTETEFLERLVEEAATIEREDRDMCAAIGRFGAELMPSTGGVLTHCNAGGLATAGDGTALSVLFAAAASGRQIHVYADETRPLLQGA